jgi:hypothetical protein
MRVVDDPELDEVQDAWLSGGSALPLIRLLASREEIVEAAAVARLALDRKGCPDAEEIESLLDQFDQPPPDWDDTLRAFAAAPTVERWREIMRFVPEDLYYQRLRNSIRRLRRMNTDPNALFLCACELGMTPDAITLVEEGLVQPAVIEERARKGGGAKATYFGLAATAAFLANDLVGAIRLLRESAAHETALCSSMPHVFFIREHATPEVNALLDKAGIAAI